jgi:hypothetical protein
LVSLSTSKSSKIEGREWNFKVLNPGSSIAAGAKKLGYYS